MIRLLMVLVFAGGMTMTSLSGQPTPTRDSVAIELSPDVFGTIFFSYTFGNEGDRRLPGNPSVILLREAGPVALLIREYDFKGFQDNKSLKTTMVFPDELPLKKSLPLVFQDKADQKFLLLDVKDSLLFQRPIRLIIDFKGKQYNAEYTIRERLRVHRPVSPPLKTSPAPAAAPPKKALQNESLTNGKENPFGAKDGDEEGAQDGELSSLDAFIADNADQPEALKERLRRTYIETEEQTTGSRSTYVLHYLSQVEILNDNAADEVEVLSQRRLSATSYEVKLNVKSAGVFKVIIQDPTKDTDFRNLTLNVGTPLNATFSQLNDSIRFNSLKGGLPPYILAFHNNSEEVYRLENVPSEGINVSIDSLSAALPEGGVLWVKMMDFRGTGSFNFEEQAVNVPELKANGFNFIPYVLVGGLVLILGLFQLLRISRKRKHLHAARERLAANIPDRRKLVQNSGVMAPFTTDDAIGEDEISAKIPVMEETGIVAPVFEHPIKAAEEDIAVKSDDLLNTPVPPDELTNSGTEPLDPAITEPQSTSRKGKKTKMRITRRRRLPESERAPFRPDLSPEGYLSLPLSTHWSNSMVSSILVGKNAIVKLDDFLRLENTSKIAASFEDRERRGWERNEAVPEIGGMLLGQYQRDPKTNRYRVSLEEFVPLEAKSQSIVRVEIDPLSLARDLSKAQDDNPDLVVVSWFHTHPGHGLFLSRPDLKIQYGHFRKPWHIAMEIDSLSANLDTAFFSYMDSGHMNNSNTLRPEIPWFSWNEIEKFAIT